jgi:NADH dehydrogenase FAD-containing subunit
MRPRIILAGAGHAHIAALRRLAKTQPEAELILVNDGAAAWYTGALPALIRREIPPDRACVNVEALAKSCGAAFINARMTGFDADRLTLEPGVALAFDILAISIGASPNGGVKPIQNFLARLQGWDQAASPSIGIIGAGPAGVELALALRHRLGAKARIALKAPQGRLLAAAPPRVQRIARAALDRAGIPLAADFPAPMDDFIHAYAPAPRWRVRTTLQLENHDNIFATGDCAGFPSPLPRSGAIAVRQGRLLASNLRRQLDRRSLKIFSPPAATLAILTLSPHQAAAWYGPLSCTGQLAMTLKKKLDSNWVLNQSLGGKA